MDIVGNSCVPKIHSLPSCRLSNDKPFSGGAEVLKSLANDPLVKPNIKAAVISKPPNMLMD